MIRGLRQQYDERLNHINKKLLDYQKGIDSFAIINDSNFQRPNDSKSTLSELDESLTVLNQNLSHLNELWVIKNLIKEIEAYMADINEVVLSLESLYINFENLLGKLSKLDSNLVVKSEVSTKTAELMDDLWVYLQEIFQKYMPSSDKLKPTIDGVDVGEFLSLVEKFSSISEKIDVNELLAENKVIWESYLLGLAFKKLTLIDTDLHIEDTDGSVLSVLGSILSFIRFINAINVQSLKNLYQPKLSNKLINLISENINILVDSSTNEYITLVEIIKVVEGTHWRLSLNLTLENYDSKMKTIYNNWIMDNYIDKIRQVFKSADFTKVSEIKWEIDGSRFDNMRDQITTMDKRLDVTMSNESKVESKADEQEGGWNSWNDEWDDNEEDPIQPTQEPQEHKGEGWDDWNEWDEDKDSQSIQAPSTQKVSLSALQEQPNPVLNTIRTTIKVSSTANKLVEVLNDFLIESQANLDPLISTILSVSTITYPSSSTSFLLYNDLQYLAKNMDNERINGFAESLINRRMNEVAKTLVQILVKIKQEENNHIILTQLASWFDSIFQTELLNSNFFKFKDIVYYAIDFVCNWVSNLIISIDEVTEYKSQNLTKLIDELNGFFNQKLLLLNETKSLESMERLSNVRFLINNHLVDIIERFYHGDFYNISTGELISVIESCFIKSELRDNYINEIVEFRNIS
ncbi:protein transport protein dsl1 [Yamadazyma tenuis]|uniref:Retrograde transport protein Dsl1 C-terminal domain-containing protein n=1 Tax=Candida tenuis (strain ATCC 10573 / BCRC 21748 / CBS 615 / JCM 9827 / NBRC 10315 / NRRL Y-1498 / VKM Y-70) TaxID=590646 RepID=G3B7Z8_CANTC|nr:uncharacterized protein CANTEDRAFT_135634 [Yamadazyma tenuis ATCC 10573]EGV61695.1 hypothetical protein CANTEDRAFT_135634 [Yamadazyma tenuis ATCC 10573]WEJ92924.1 protein transport protein dsl1 [Yamadazyma tenuis]